MARVKKKTQGAVMEKIDIPVQKIFGTVSRKTRQLMNSVLYGIYSDMRSLRSQVSISVLQDMAQQYDRDESDK